MEAQQSPQVSIIVPTVGQSDCIRDCIESALSQEGVTTEVIVVDNSGGREVSHLLAGSANSVRIVDPKMNVGVSKAFNIAARQARGEYLIFLDDDVILSKNAAFLLKCSLETDSKIGIVGPLMLEYANPQSIRFAGSRVGLLSGRTSLIMAGETLSPEVPDLIAVCSLGDCSMVRKALFMAMNGYDEAFFFLFQDADLCYRVLESGKKVVCVSRVHAWHKTRKASRELVSALLGLETPKRAFLVGRNRVLFMRKHAGIRFWLFAIAAIPSDVAVSLLVTLADREPILFRSFASGLIGGLELALAGRK